MICSVFVSLTGGIYVINTNSKKECDYRQKHLTRIVTVISTPGGTVEDVDQTCIAEDVKRYLPGAYDGNEITLTIHHYTGDATQAALIEAANSNAIVDIQVEFQDGTTCDITVALKSAQMQEISLSETLKWDIIGKQSGKAVWTLPSA